MFFFKRKKIVVGFLIVFFSLLIFFVFYRNFYLVLDIVYPIQISIKKISDLTIKLENIFIENKKLYEENQRLKQELQKLKLETQTLKAFKIENEKLKKLLKFSKKYKFKRKIVAEVIGYPSESWIKGLIINKGSKDRVKIGDLVITDGYLVGKITKVGYFSSFVLLVNDSNFKITGRTKNTREFVFYKGNGKDGGNLEYIKPNQDIRVGDIVETDNPKGIPIGIIKNVSYQEGDFFKKAEVEAFIKQLNIEYVLILGK